MFSVTLATSREEHLNASFLVKEVFGENFHFPIDACVTSDDNLANNFFSHKVFTIKNGAEVIGVIKVVPTIFELGSNTIKSAGITAVCMREQYKGRGLSKKLMEEVLTWSHNNSFEMTHLVARKAVDGYYNKFGYFGASSYQNITIKGIQKQKASVFELNAGFDVELIKLYNAAYIFSYNKSFGRVMRNCDYWLAIRDRITRDKLNFFTVTNNKIPCGYVALNGDIIVELGILDGYEVMKFIDSMLYTFSFLLKLEIPFHHQIINALTNYDVTYHSRQCLFGGHMIKIFYPNKVFQAQNKNSHKNEKLPDITPLATFAEQNKEYRLSVGLPLNIDNTTYFNLSYFDQL